MLKKVHLEVIRYIYNSADEKSQKEMLLVNNLQPFIIAFNFKLDEVFQFLFDVCDEQTKQQALEKFRAMLFNEDNAAYNAISSDKDINISMTLFEQDSLENKQKYHSFFNIQT